MADSKNTQTTEHEYLVPVSYMKQGNTKSTEHEFLEAQKMQGNPENQEILVKDKKSTKNMKKRNKETAK